MKTLIAIALLMLLPACMSPTLEPGDDARDIDSELLDTAYHFDFQRQCFCVREAVQPVTIFVRDGSVERVVARESGEVLGEGPVEWPTMEAILTEVGEAEARGDLTTIRYSDQHLPSYVEIGSLAADAGYIYEIGRVVRDR